MQMCQKWCLPAFYDLMSVLGHGLLSESGCKHEGVLAEVEGRPMQLITEAIASATVTALPSDLCTCRSKQGQENCDYRHVFRTCLEATSSAHRNQDTETRILSESLLVAIRRDSDRLRLRHIEVPHRKKCAQRRIFQLMRATLPNATQTASFTKCLSLRLLVCSCAVQWALRQLSG